MAPETHLLASWLIAAKSTRNLRDCRLVALSGILPDADGLGLVVDLATRWTGMPETAFYHAHHHYLFHGLFGALVTAGVLTCFARDRLRVALLCLAVFHFHLLCDLVGSRGPAPQDLWPIHYFGPFSREPVWLWGGQWPLNGWPNIVFSWVLIVVCIGLAIQRGDSFVGVINRWADAIFVRVLQRWYGSIRERCAGRHSSCPSNRDNHSDPPAALDATVHSAVKPPEQRSLPGFSIKNGR